MSNSNMSGPAEIVVGTAGHIDHGKTSLVRALTGIDTDTLAEEKARGISIDLGFAHLRLPDGVTIAFVDVPGHERFIRNMLAGAGGIEAVLLIVAADEAIKPQTREHLQICSLLGIERGILAITKSDLVSPEKLAETCAAVRELALGTFLASAPLVALDSLSGRGLPELRAELSRLAGKRTLRDPGGLVRLPVDRSFSRKGFGTVVTGTLWRGTLNTGDSVELHPGARPARVRGLQFHGSPVPAAFPGQRAAVNLSGIEQQEIRRGFVLTRPGDFRPVEQIYVSIDWLPEDGGSGGQREFLFHAGTAEIVAQVKPLAGSGRGKRLARISLAEPALIVPGDRFVLRRPSPPATVGGGVVLDIHEPRRVKRADRVQRLERFMDEPLAGRLALLVGGAEAGLTIDELKFRTGEAPATIRAAVAQNPALFLTGERVLTRAWLEERRSALTAWLKSFHEKNPDAAGAPMAQARLGLEPALAAAVFENHPAIRVQGDLLSLARHQAQQDPQVTALLIAIEGAFARAGVQPPPPEDVLKSANTDPRSARDLLEKLIKAQKLVRVSPALVYHPAALAQLRKPLEQRRGRRFSVPEFKEWTQLSRKHAIPLLEYFDHQRVTRREGDLRLVL